MTITTKKAEECARGQDAIKESSQLPGYRSIAERAGATIRSLAAERDALKKRVAKLDGALQKIQTLARTGRPHPMSRKVDYFQIAATARAAAKEDRQP